MVRKGTKGLGCPEARDSVSGRKEWGAAACHREVKQGASGRLPHLATSSDTGALRGTGPHTAWPGPPPQVREQVCTQGAPDRCRCGPILGYARPSGSRSHCPPPALLHSGASHQLGLGAVPSEPWPACRAERKYLRMY